MSIQPGAGRATSPASASFSLKAFYQGLDPTIGLHLGYPLATSRHEASLMGDLTHFGIWRPDMKPLSVYNNTKVPVIEQLNPITDVHTATSTLGQFNVFGGLC